MHLKLMLLLMRAFQFVSTFTMCTVACLFSGNRGALSQMCLQGVCPSLIAAWSFGLNAVRMSFQICPANIYISAKKSDEMNLDHKGEM